jgi:hypothetical protein
VLILGCLGTYHVHREGSKGQKVKKIISENTEARNMKFSQNIYFYSGKTNPSKKIDYYLYPPQKPQK